MFESPRLKLNARFGTATREKPIARGEKGRAVEVLQQCLVDLGMPMPRSTKAQGLMDGIFGPETEATVKRFQGLNGLAMDGMVGPKTLAAMDRLLLAREHAFLAKALATSQQTGPNAPCIAT